MLPLWGAYIIACVAFGMSAYGIWMEPAKLRAQRDIASSNKEMTKALVGFMEWLDRREALQAEVERLNRENERLRKR